MGLLAEIVEPNSAADVVDAATREGLTILGALLVASALAWLVLLVRRVGQPLIPCEPRADVPWDGFDMLVLVLANFLFQAVCIVVAARLEGIELTEAALRAQPLVLLASTATSAVLWLVFAHCHLRFRPGTTWADLGWQSGTIGRDVRLGLVGFVLVCPLVLALQWLLMVLLEPTTFHPYVTTLSREHEAAVAVLAVLSAVLVAPLAEEFLFRVVLQGWLERRMGAPSAAHLPAPIRAAAPIVVAALAFALMHIEHGTAPIPLFFLAVALGYLYRQTHRVLPCIVLHATLNAYSMIQLLYVTWTVQSP